MNFDVFASLMGDYVRLWEKPSLEYQSAVQVIMSGVVESLTNEHTKSYPQLRTYVNLSLQKFFERNQKKVIDLVS